MPKEITLGGILAQINEVQPENALFPMEVTLVGIITEVSDVQY